MLCCRCRKNIAVVFVTKMDADGNNRNDEGYCLTCAKELNLGAVDSIIERMGIDPEEMDNINLEMQDVMNELKTNGDFDIGEEMRLMSKQLRGEDIDDDDDLNDEYYEDEDEDMSRSIQKNPFEFMNNIFGKSNKSDNSEDSKSSSVKREKENGKFSRKKKKKHLDAYGTNLTEKARRGEIDAVIGRNNEISRCAQILNRRTKNNPCLIGEAGVGKTAIAEGLALRIAEGNAPAKLLDHEIYMLDMTAMVAGTQFRGQFEARLKNVISEVKDAGNIILVIDEIHTIATAGDAEGGMNAGNILKPALSRGEIQVIGATTIEEYRKHIEKDAALERRFQTVMVEEPTLDETIEILKGVREYYEDYHNVEISDLIVTAAATLADRYINDRFMPDKAIDVLDEAASKANLENTRLIDIQKLKTKAAELERELADKEESVSNANESEGEAIYAEIAELKAKEYKIKAELDKLESENKPVKLTTQDIAAVIESWTKIPVKHISEYETERLIGLEDKLHEHVISQDDAVDAVSRAIRRKRVGISLKHRPISFIFVGPTGVGKTELVKRIAEEVYDGEDSLIRLDMSEYMEKHSVSKLIGSPPGYVGYDDAGQLTEKVRRRPYSVILLDEIEKAHADVFNILLQILDDGRITDSHGRTVSFENAIIIMTSNAGSESSSGVVGFNEANEAIEMKANRALRELFRPEFLNRVDEVIVFKQLEKDALLKIIDLMLDDLREGLIEKNIKIEISSEAKELILKDSYNRQYGARPMRRYIEKHIEDALAHMIILGTLSEGQTALVTSQDNKIFVEVK